MVQPVNNLAQQTIVSPFQRGDQQQRQVDERQTRDQSAISARDTQTSQTRRTGTSAAQSQDPNAGSYSQNKQELSVSELRQEFKLENNERPPRGSLIDISA